MLGESLTIQSVPDASLVDAIDGWVEPLLLTVALNHPGAVLLLLGAPLRTNSPGIQKPLAGLAGAASTGTLNTLSRLGRPGAADLSQLEAGLVDQADAAGRGRVAPDDGRVGELDVFFDQGTGRIDGGGGTGRTARRR